MTYIHNMTYQLSFGLDVIGYLSFWNFKI